jgi:hypothetical protein
VPDYVIQAVNPELTKISTLIPEDDPLRESLKTLGLSENASIDDIQKEIDRIETDVYSEALNLNAEIQSLPIGSKRRKELEQKFNAMGQAGRFAVEQQVSEDVAEINLADKVMVGGKEYELADMLADETISEAITNYLANDKEALSGDLAGLKDIVDKYSGELSNFISTSKDVSLGFDAIQNEYKTFDPNFTKLILGDNPKEISEKQLEELREYQDLNDLITSVPEEYRSDEDLLGKIKRKVIKSPEDITNFIRDKKIDAKIAAFEDIDDFVDGVFVDDTSISDLKSTYIAAQREAEKGGKKAAEIVAQFQKYLDKDGDGKIDGKSLADTFRNNAKNQLEGLSAEDFNLLNVPTKEDEVYESLLPTIEKGIPNLEAMIQADNERGMFTLLDKIKGNLSKSPKAMNEFKKRFSTEIYPSLRADIDTYNTEKENLSKDIKSKQKEAYPLIVELKDLKYNMPSVRNVSDIGNVSLDPVELKVAPADAERVRDLESRLKVINSAIDFKENSIKNYDRKLSKLAKLKDFK